MSDQAQLREAKGILHNAMRFDARAVARVDSPSIEPETARLVSMQQNLGPLRGRVQCCGDPLHHDVDLVDPQPSHLQRQRGVIRLGFDALIIGMSSRRLSRQ
jgi:hypothetical protein